MVGGGGTEQSALGTEARVISGEGVAESREEAALTRMCTSCVR